MPTHTEPDTTAGTADRAGTDTTAGTGTGLAGSGEPLPCFVAGKWVAPSGATTLPVVAPATGEVIAQVCYGDAELARSAADAAGEAFEDWSSRPARLRGDILREAGTLLASRADSIGRLLCAETGKRLSEAVAEVRFAAEYLYWFAEEARRPSGQVMTPEDPRRRHLSFSRPAGVAACLTPWNFPVSIPARKVAPALAAGCTVVTRGSEKAPLALAELFRALEDAGLPAGAANLVNGPAAAQSEALLSHPAVRVVSFTGSTAVGSRLMGLASARVLRCALELGGNAPFVIFADADLDAAIEGLLVAKFRNNGQSCIAANRVYVQDEVYDEVAARLGEATSELVLGDPLGDSAVDLGPLIERQRVTSVEAMVDEALASGARWLGDAPQVPGGGCYTRPGFLTDVAAEVALATTEVFAPVSGVFRFHDEEEVLERANATEMGLAGYVYTSDVSRGWRMAERLEVGILGLNHPLPSTAFAPLGGVKQSGIGREGAHQGLEEFTVTRYLSVGI